jgi:hypothetical protein
MHTATDILPVARVAELGICPVSPASSACCCGWDWGCEERLTPCMFAFLAAQLTLQQWNPLVTVQQLLLVVTTVAHTPDPDTQVSVNHTPPPPYRVCHPPAPPLHPPSSGLTVQSVLHETHVSPSGAKAIPFTALV